MDQPLPDGKSPEHLLESFLTAIDIDDPSILIEARLGEDIAAVDVSGEDTLEKSFLVRRICERPFLVPACPGQDDGGH